MSEVLCLRSCGLQEVALHQQARPLQQVAGLWLQLAPLENIPNLIAQFSVRLVHAVPPREVELGHRMIRLHHLRELASEIVQVRRYERSAHQYHLRVLRALIHLYPDRAFYPVAKLGDAQLRYAGKLPRGRSFDQAIILEYELV